MKAWYVAHTHAKAERQAEEFAAWLLGGPDGWQRTASELSIPQEKHLLLQGLGSPIRPTGDHGGQWMEMPMG